MPELSSRLQRAANTDSFLGNGLNMYRNNPYNATTNPNGIINFGTAENKLMYDDLHQRLSEVDLSKMPISMAQYNNFNGNEEFREHLSNFMNHYMAPTMEIQPDNLIVFNGCGTAIEGLGYSFCDPNDGILIPTPYYGAFKSDLGQRGNIQLCDFSFPKNYKNSSTIIAAALKDGLTKWQHKGVDVKALLLTNPDNPTGRIYNLKEIEVFLEFCLQNNLHVIVDEIYYFSAHDIFTKMESVLAVPNFERYKEIVHMVWAFSKDFSLSGFRCGVLVTFNKQLYRHICQISLFSASSSVSQHIIQHLIDDFDWVDQYIETNHRRLRRALDSVITVFKDLDIEYVGPSAGLFVWFNLNKYIKGKPCEEEDKKMFSKFLQRGLYVAPGFAFFNHEFGWFRIIFSTTPEELSLGMSRFREVVM